MGRIRQKSRFRISDFGFRILGMAVIVVAGCTTLQPLPVCPGKSNAQEALQALSVRAGQAVTFRAGGQCRLAYHVPDERGVKRYSLALPLVWFCPPSDMYIRGSITADPKVVIIGSNQEEFWLTLRPKEISSYYWGRWDQATSAEGPMINPGVVLEAFGLLGHNDPNAAWSFEKQGPYDVLTRLDAAGQPVKRVHIYTCDYLVRKMEYFGRDGVVVAVAELGKYKSVTESFQVPTQIHVTTIGKDRREDTIDIQLDSLKATELSEQARQRMFKRDPNDMGRFDHVYRLEDGHWVGD